MDALSAFFSSNARHGGRVIADFAQKYKCWDTRYAFLQVFLHSI